MTRAPHRALSMTVLALAACSTPDPPSLLPVDYASTFSRVRPCRPSPDHDLDFVLVLADPAAAAVYRDRVGAFPTNAVLVKEEHAADDADCTGPVMQWTVMQQLSAGSAPSTHDWRWQLIGTDGRVLTQDDKRCISCHASCGFSPDGYAGTCSPP